MLSPDELKMVRARKVVDNGTGPFAIPLAQLTESIITNDKLDQLLAKEAPEYPEIEIPDFPSEITVVNLPEVQKVEITNLPKDKDKDKDGKEQIKLLKQIAEELKKKEQYAYDIEIDPDLKSQLRGVQGTPGKDGSPDTAEQIADKLNTLEEKVELSVLKGWKEFIANLGEKTSATRVYGTRMLRNLVDVIGAKDATTGQVLTKQTDGTFAFEDPFGGGASLTVQDVDGTPTVTNVTAIKFTNGAVTDNGDGTVNVTTGSGGGGDVSSNTATSVDSEIAVFSGTGGKTIKRSTTTGILKGTSGVISAATADTDYLTPGTAATTYQPLDSDLTTIAGLAASNDDFIQRKAGAWSNRTVAQVKTDLGLTGTNSGDQNMFSTIAVSGQSDVVADSTSDTLTLVAGANVTITTNASTDTITISSSGGGGGGYTETFETVSQNFNEYPYTITYSGGEISTITYDLGGGQSIVKTFNYTSGNITTIVLSGDTPSGINLTKTFTYSSGNIVSVAYS